MRFLRTIFASALISVCAVGTAEAADEPAAAPTPCYQSRYTNHGVTNNQLIFNNGSYRAFVDRRVQRASHPTCVDYVRAAVNFRCQRANQQGVWVPVNCGSDGLVILYEDGWERGNGYEFGSTGPDGTISVYTRWVQLGACKPYWTDLAVDQITMNYQVQYNGDGYIGRSATYTGCASNPPAGEIRLQKSGSAPASTDYRFGSTGTDGTISVYGEWAPYASCSLYWGELGITQVTINNQVQFRNGDGGKSEAFRECP